MFSVVLVLAIVDCIFWFSTSLSNETWSFEPISSLLLYNAQQHKKVLKPSFSNLGFKTQTDHANPAKVHFKPEKDHFLVYFNRASIHSLSSAGLPHSGTAELHTPFSKHSSLDAPFRCNIESHSYFTEDPMG